MFEALSRTFAGALLFALAAAACAGGATPSTSTGLDVVVTTSVLGDVVRSLVADDGRVEVLMEAGQDPHGFSLSARQAESLRAADLVISNGLGLEASLTDALAAAVADGVPVLAVAERVDPLAYAEPGDEHDEHDDHGSLDPHVWYDPVRMAVAAEVIAAELAAADNALGDEAWATRGAAVADELRATDADVRATLAGIPAACRVLVTNHDSFGYFAARYDFEIIGTIVPGTSGQAEPSAREFAELVAVVRDSGVPAIFAETSQSTRLAASLAGEVGRDVQVIELYTDALGPVGSGADTYRGMMVVNAQRMAAALASC